MSRVWKRSRRHLELVLAMVAFASGDMTGDMLPTARAAREPEVRGAPHRHEHDDDRLSERRQVHTVRSAGETDAPVAVAQDRWGNVLTLGNHQTPIDFGQGALDSPAGASVLTISKHAPDGRLSWVRLFEAPPRAGTNPLVRGQALAVEKQGTLLVLGVQSGGLRLGTNELPPGAFLARLDAEGSPLWARALPTTATKLAVDERGRITLAGVLTGQVDFGNGPVTGAGNPYLVQLDATGALRWVFVDSARGMAMDLALDNTGELYLAGGRFRPSSVRPSPFLTRLSSEGRLRWTRQLEGALGQAMSVAARGDSVVVSGHFTGRFVFRGTPLLAPNTSRGFALAYDRDGDERWGVLLGSTWGLVAMGEDSDVVLAGRYNGGEDFGLDVGPLEGYPGTTNLYVLRLERPSGKLQWVRTHPSASALPVDLSVGQNGEGVLTGIFRAPVDLGSGPLSPGPGGNTFLLQWQH